MICEVDLTLRGGASIIDGNATADGWGICLCVSNLSTEPETFEDDATDAPSRREDG